MTNFLYFSLIFFILFLIGLFPFFRQTKKNLMWFVVTVIFISALLIVDLGVEFLAFSYLIIYIGAVAVMFLFVIVAVDPKFENQKDTFEKMVIPALTLNNFLVFFIYFWFSAARMFKGPVDANHFLLLKNELSLFFFNYHNETFLHEFQPFIKYNGAADLHNNVFDNWFKNDLSFYKVLELKLKDINIFSDFFFNEHGILLVIIGFILTTAMVVSVIVAKDCARKF